MDARGPDQILEAILDSPTDQRVHALVTEKPQPVERPLTRQSEVGLLGDLISRESEDRHRGGEPETGSHGLSETGDRHYGFRTVHSVHERNNRSIGTGLVRTP